MQRSDEQVASFFKTVYPPNFDWMRTRPFWYTKVIDVPVEADGIGKASITITDQPHVFFSLTHSIVGHTWDAWTSGLFNDGQYTIDMRDEFENYMNQPVLASILAGPAAGGADRLVFPIPIPCAGSRTFQFEIQNQWTRTLSPESDYFQVAIALHCTRDVGSSVRDLIR